MEYYYQSKLDSTLIIKTDEPVHKSNDTFSGTVVSINTKTKSMTGYEIDDYSSGWSTPVFKLLTNKEVEKLNNNNMTDYTNGWNEETFKEITDIQKKQEGKVMNGFILSTAKDYDMDYVHVETIYNTYYKIGDSNRFYQELESFIKNRSEND